MDGSGQADDGLPRLPPSAHQLPLQFARGDFGRIHPELGLPEIVRSSTWIEYDAPELLGLRRAAQLVLASRVLIAIWACVIVVAAFVLRSDAGDGVVASTSVTRLGYSGLLVVTIAAATGWYWSDRVTQNIHRLEGRLPSRVRAVSGWVVPIVWFLLLSVTLLRLDPTEVVDIWPFLAGCIFVAALWRPYSLMRRLIRSLIRVDSDLVIAAGFVLDLAVFGLLWARVASLPSSIGPDDLGVAGVLIGVSAVSAIAAICNVAVWVLIVRDVENGVRHRSVAMRTRHDHRQLRLLGIDPLDPQVRLALMHIQQEIEEELAEAESVADELVEEELVEPVEEPVEEELVEPVEEPVEEELVEPVEEELVEPVEEPVEEELVEPVEEELVEPVEEPVEDELVEPVEEELVEPVEEPVEDELVEPVEELVENELVADELVEPVEELVEEELVEEESVEPVEEPVEDELVEPVEELVEEESVEPVEEPVEDELVEPVEEELVEPVEEQPAKESREDKDPLAAAAARFASQAPVQPPDEVSSLEAAVARSIDEPSVGPSVPTSTAEDVLDRIAQGARRQRGAAAADPLGRLTGRISDATELGAREGESILQRLEKFGIQPGGPAIGDDGIGPVAEALRNDDNASLTIDRLYSLETARYLLLLALAACTVAATWLMLRAIDVGELVDGDIAPSSVDRLEEARSATVWAVIVSLWLVPLWSATAARWCARIGTPVPGERRCWALTVVSTILVGVFVVADPASGAVLFISAGLLGAAMWAISVMIQIDRRFERSDTVPTLVPLSLAFFVLLLWVGRFHRPVSPEDSLEGISFFGGLLAVSTAIAAVITSRSTGETVEAVKLSPGAPRSKRTPS